jgi:hypothetical protein
MFGHYFASLMNPRMVTAAALGVKLKLPYKSMTFAIDLI